MRGNLPENRKRLNHFQDKSRNRSFFEEFDEVLNRVMEKITKALTDHNISTDSDVGRIFIDVNHQLF